MSENKGCLLAFLKLFNHKTQKPPIYIAKKILSNAELSFYHCLKNNLDDKHVIFCKVRLEDIINIKKGIENYNTERNRIKSKHLDFVICDSQSLEIQRIIELDDSSHEYKKEADEFKDSALKEAGLIIVRCPAKRTYTNEDITRLLA